MSLLWLNIAIQGSGGSSKNKPRDLTPVEFKNQRGLVADSLVDTIEGRGPKIEGPFVAPLTGGERTGLDALKFGAFAEGGLGSDQEAALRAALTGGQENPFLQDAIQSSSRAVLQNAELEELRDRALFGTAGQKLQGSSAFTEERVRDVGNTEQTIANIATELSFADVQRRSRERLEAAALTNARFAEQRQTIETLALPRLVEQFGLDKANEEAARRIKAIEEAIALLGELGSPKGQIGQKGSAVNASVGIADIGGGGGGTATTG